MQLCMVRDDRGWQRGLACRRSFDPTGPGQSTVFPRLRPNGAATRGCSVVGLRANNLQPCGQFQSNGTGQTIYNLVDSFSRTGPGKQSTVLWTASVERDPATLCSLGLTALWRFVNAALFRPTKSAAQPRSNDAVPLRRCNSASSGRVRSAALLSMP